MFLGNDVTNRSKTELQYWRRLYNMDQCKVGLEVVFKEVDDTYQQIKRFLFGKKSKSKSGRNSVTVGLKVKGKAIVKGAVKGAVKGTITGTLAGGPAGAGAGAATGAATRAATGALKGAVKGAVKGSRRSGTSSRRWG